MRNIFDPEASDQRAASPSKRPVCFGIGRISTTPGARAAIDASGELDITYVYKHSTGEWGETPFNERAANLRAARTGRGSVLSMHRLKSGERLWLATSDDRSSTALFIPEEVGEVIFTERVERDAIAA
jgi:hypothetical protein